MFKLNLIAFGLLSFQMRGYKLRSWVIRYILHICVPLHLCHYATQEGFSYYSCELLINHSACSSVSFTPLMAQTLSLSVYAMRLLAPTFMLEHFFFISEGPTF